MPRLNVGRARTLRLYGPEGIIGAVDHKLKAYNRNLVDRFECDLIIEVTKVAQDLHRRRGRFRPESWDEQRTRCPPRLVSTLAQAFDSTGRSQLMKF